MKRIYFILALIGYTALFFTFQASSETASSPKTISPQTTSTDLKEQNLDPVEIFFQPEVLKDKIKEGRIANEQWRKSKTEWFDDYAGLEYYALDNNRIQANKQYPEIVFIGDDIFERWNLKAMFPNENYLNRGIDSQVTDQMLLRFRNDVLNNRPKQVIILAGGNDIAGYLGLKSDQMIENNIKAMISLAQIHGVKVILTSILLVNPYTPNAELSFVLRPIDRIKKLNEFLKAQVQPGAVSYLDLNTSLRDDSGFLSEAYSEDGLHPNQTAYTIMAQQLRSHLERLEKEEQEKSEGETALSRKIESKLGSFINSDQNNKIRGFFRTLPEMNSLASRQLVSPEAYDKAQQILNEQRSNYRDKLMINFAQLDQYMPDNQRVLDSKNDYEYIFFGDSIIEWWPLSKNFPKKKLLNRGIAGQTTSQMLLRFTADVIANKPKSVVILAGVNDLSGWTGPISLENIAENIASMVEIARANNIRVILSSLLPVRDQPLVNSDDIVKLNQWIERYCHDNALTYIDFYTSMVDSDGFIMSNLSDDGLHPNTKGYQLMQVQLDNLLN